ncbi:MAG: ATP-binding cassette domain-containing protein, partial [Spirochaetia bacterium]|nr:ATP-binding cassette domain-containing protein [Spirochaetia bacterium]
MQPQRETPLLQLTRVSKRFGTTQALRDISLTVRPGERIALIGPSGAGKSTLLGILNTSLTPDSGSYEWKGADVASLPHKKLLEIRRAIGTIYQRFHLTENLAVIHNLNAGRIAPWSFARSLVSLLFPREIKASRKILESVGIPEKLFSRTGDLSGGQMQRVAIARVIAQNPELILADEITASVDPERARRVMDLIVRLSREGGK